MHDLHVLLSELLAIMIDEEGDKYINSSAIVPRLTSAITKINGMFENASRPNDKTFLNADEVLRWRPTFDALVARYIEPFCSDEAFLVATLLDRRFGVETLPHWLLAAANIALTARLAAVHDQLEAERAAALRQRYEQQQQAAAAVPVDANLHVNVALARELQVFAYQHDAVALARAFGDADVASAGPPPDLPTFRTVADEKAALRALPPLKMTDDPMLYYSPSSPHKLELARRVAVDVLAMPSGESPCERIFSIASRVLGQSRHKMSPAQLERLVFIKKNVANFKEKN